MHTSTPKKLEEINIIKEHLVNLKMSEELVLTTDSSGICFSITRKSEDSDEFYMAYPPFNFNSQSLEDALIQLFGGQEASRTLRIAVSSLSSDECDERTTYGKVESLIKAAECGERELFDEDKKLLLKVLSTPRLSYFGATPSLLMQRIAQLSTQETPVPK
jgi:hypothetical protein